MAQRKLAAVSASSDDNQSPGDDLEHQVELDQMADQALLDYAEAAKALRDAAEARGAFLRGTPGMQWPEEAHRLGLFAAMAMYDQRCRMLKVHVDAALGVDTMDDEVAA